MSKRIAISQSNYIPWKGYFSMIADVDEFVLFDDMQYTRRDWRNRNLIKTPQGLHWLTIPVDVKGKYHQKINETRINDLTWAGQHWKTIQMNYSKACCFKKFAPVFENLYATSTSELLSEINYKFITAICEILGIKTRITWSSDYEVIDGKTSRLVSICEQAGATDYVSGPAAKDYIEADLFSNSGINLHWFSYKGYPEYSQLFGNFEHGVSIIDLLFNAGDDAQRLMTRNPDAA